MGCKGSKLEEQEAVALCRGRADLLAAAVRHRYALADAHGALAESLASVASSLHMLLLPPPEPATSPRLALPSAGKEVSPPPPPRASSPQHSSSHIAFSSGSGSEPGSVSSSPRHRAVGHHEHLQHTRPHALPYPHYGYGYGYAPEPPFGYPPPPGSLQLYYARSRPPPASVAVEQRAAAPERVYFGSIEPAGGYSQYHSYGGEPSSAGWKAAPPPSPPRTSSWDFFNVFDNYEVYDNYCYDAGGAGASATSAYTPSRSSREVREEEGIPELEEDDVVVKEVSSEYSTPGSGGARSRRSSVGGVSSSIAEADEEENCIVDKKMVGGGNIARQQAPTHRNASMTTTRRASQSADVAGEIKAQFVRAADAVRALAPILEVGRRYHPRNSVYHVSSRMASAIALPHSGYGGEEFLIAGGEKVVGAKSLSLTLQKLYIWEKKLYDEVKAEEKMRLLLAKNSKRLKFLDQKGAEAHKIEVTRNLVRKLSTKIRIAVRVIAKVSKKINRVRDEELWPQINSLIQGFVKMWQDKQDCYQIQCQAVAEAKNLDSLISGGSNQDLAMELELELIKWIVNFSSWVNSQRSFVKALNGWLALCLNYQQEETADGVPPYSPGRVGAPLLFVICNSWSQAMDRISEKGVVTTMQALVTCVRNLWEQKNVEQSEQIITIREREKWSKILERKTLEMNKEAHTLNRKLALVPGRQTLLPMAQTYQAHFLEADSVQTSLKRALEALESFASSSLQALEETLSHAEEEMISRENAKAS